MRRVMTTAGLRVGQADMEELTELVTIRDEMNGVIQRAVDGLREDGYTWESIGAATGTTRQAALMKWGPTAKARRGELPDDAGEDPDVLEVRAFDGEGLAPEPDRAGRP